MSEYLFSYGTLREDRVQLELFGRLLHGSKDILKGYTTSSIEITDASFLSRGEEKQQLTAVNADNAAIQGMVFEISEEELVQADTYEPQGYARFKVELESRKQAWLYLMLE